MGLHGTLGTLWFLVLTLKEILGHLGLGSLPDIDWHEYALSEYMNY